jgi:propionyl-CoA synthetase
MMMLSTQLDIGYPLLLSKRYLSTISIFKVIMHNELVAEAVVIGVADEIKGEIPIGFVTLKEGQKLTTQQEIQKFEKKVVERVRHEFGPVASFKTCIIVDKLPKTRSGKYLRNIMRKMANHEEYKVPPTIEDPTILAPLDKLIKSHGFGKDVNIEYE